MILRDVYAEIDLDAVRHNLKEIRRRINPASKLCAVVKANAYGHGALAVSKVAVDCGADFLAVATVDEGLELRRAGFSLPILILGLIPQDAASAVVDNDLTQAVADFELAEKISRLPNVELEGMFSHFADADSLDSTFTNRQIKIFSRALSIKKVSVPLRR